jgi:hypothetical protein
VGSHLDDAEHAHAADRFAREILAILERDTMRSQRLMRHSLGRSTALLNQIRRSPIDHSAAVLAQGDILMYERLSQHTNIRPHLFTAEQEQHLTSLLAPPYRNSKAFASLSELLARFGDALISNGAYGLLTAETAQKLTPVCLEFFPTFRGAVIVFARDWLSNLYGADFSRIQANKPIVVVFDINSGEAFNTHLDIHQFHETVALDDPQMCFDVDLYQEWCQEQAPLTLITRCVGYTIPLALGGADDLTNMAETDLEVYWSLTGQIGQP